MFSKVLKIYGFFLKLSVLCPKACVLFLPEDFLQLYYECMSVNVRLQAEESGFSWISGTCLFHVECIMRGQVFSASDSLIE